MDDIKAITIGRVPDEAAARFGDAEALCFQGRRWSHAEYAAEVDRVAKGLMAIGVEPDEKVALWMVNRPEWLFAFYAAVKIGAVLVPLNTRYRTGDVAYTVRQSDTATWIIQARSGPVDYLAMVRENLPLLDGQDPLALAVLDFPALRRVVVLGEAPDPGMTAWESLLAAGNAISDAALAERAAAVNPDDICLIAFTSGTTGNPKGVTHCHNLIRNSIDRLARFATTTDDVIITGLPLFHCYALGEGALACALSGARQVLTESFDAAETLDLIAQEGVTMVHGFDTHFKDLMDEQARKPRNLSSLRLGTLPAGGPNSAPVAWRAQDELVPTISGWGMTEAWVFAAASSPDDTPEQRCDASGVPMPDMEFRVIDPETGLDRPVGEQGELLVRSYSVTPGYYGKPEETAKAIDAEGWLHTGDTALLREDGHIRFIGRFKDMLKVGGENVAPVEVEAHLMEIPGIHQVAVVGYPDERLAEVPLAFIVPIEGMAVTVDDIEAHCRGRIAGFKIPRHVILTDALPMTPTGKVQKHILRERALAALVTPAGSGHDTAQEA